MNVLSLFDGMSCGQIALNRCGIEYENYYASEIDKYAIIVAQKNFPKTIHVGDVRAISASQLLKIDLLIGGSPCQGFSFAGKGLNFEDERSKLFFEYVRLLKECNPKYFLLENVKMKKEYEQVINKILGCQPIRLNSALVSAQNRQRLYWTNIPVNRLPIDKGIMLKDIIESGKVDRDKSYCIDACYYKGGSLKNYLEKARRQIVMHQSEKILMVTQLSRGFNKGNVFTDKSPTISSNSWQHNNHLTDGNFIRMLSPIECERLQTVPDNYTNHVSNTQRYKMLGNGWTIDIICHIFSFMKSIT